MRWGWVLVVTVLAACPPAIAPDGPLEACALTLPAGLVLEAGVETFSLGHAGAGACLVESITLDATPAGSFELELPVALPHRLTRAEQFDVTIRTKLGTPFTSTGTLSIATAGAAPRTITLRRAQAGGGCLVTSAPSLDFGTVAQGCSSPARAVMLRNTCVVPLLLEGLSVTDPAFLLRTGFAPATPLLPGAPPLPVAYAFAPSTEGRFAAALSVSSAEEGTLVVALEGWGAPPTEQVDVFTSDPPAVVDALVMVDASPSFVGKRAGVRAGLERLFRAISARCVDLRVGLAPADGAADAGVQLLPADAGTQWFSSGAPRFPEELLGAFDQLAVGSEVEACVGPAADLLSDAGVRAGALFSGLCITDALEQSPSPAAALQRFLSVSDGGDGTWSVVSGKGSGCSVEADDDGTHASLVAASSGAHVDICDPTWEAGLLPLGLNALCGQRLTFFLTGTPAMAPSVELDGQPVAPTAWRFDAAANAVVFSADSAPRPGQTLSIRYRVACW